MEPRIAARPVEVCADHGQRSSKARPHECRHARADACGAAGLERYAREQRQRAVPLGGTVGLVGIDGTQLVEQRPLRRAKLRQHDDVGRRRREVALELIDVVGFVPGVEREHAQVLGRRVPWRGHAWSTPPACPMGAAAAPGEAEPDVQSGRRYDAGRQDRRHPAARQQGQAGSQPDADEMAGQRREDVRERGEAAGDGGDERQIGGCQHEQRQPSAPERARAKAGKFDPNSPNTRLPERRLPK